jgi:transcriptional regulator PpsR
VGRPWVDTVTAPTRRKIERLLREVAVSGVSGRCEVSHLLPSGEDVPVAYSAVRLGHSGPVLVAGRDLRAIAAIQQRFVKAQQQMERDYWKRREAESRYRRLFHVATDAVLVVDGPTLRILEGNTAAAERLGLPSDALAGRDVLAAFDAASRPVVGTLCAEARATGRSAEFRAWLTDRVAAVDVAATPFRTGDADLLQLRLRTIAQAAAAGPDGEDGTARLVDFVERTPDGVVITDTGGRVLNANAAFAALCGLPDATAAEGRPIDAWLDAGLRAAQPGGASVLDEVRRCGFVQRVRGRLVTGSGADVPIELSATMLADQDDLACIGFSLRRADTDASLPDSWALRARLETRALLSRVGELPLSTLLEHAAALAERHFVARALELAQGDRDRAARMLGLERSALDARLAATGGDPGVSPE